MKVCMISGTLPDLRCGVGDYTYWLCTELKRHNDIELDIVISKHSMARDIEDIEVRPIIKKWSFPSLFLLVRSLKKRLPDLVHIQYPTQAYKNKPMINFFPIIFKLLFREIPLIVTIHDAKTAHPLNKLRLVPFLFFAKKIILTADEEKEYLVKRFPFLKSRFEAIHIGSNIRPCELIDDGREKMRQNLGLEKGEILVSHFGYILPKKRLEIIFYSIRRLLDEGYRVKLALISSFYPERDRYHARLKRIVDELSLYRYVIWTGYRTEEEVAKYLSSSDICVQVYHDGVSLRRSSFIAPLSHSLPIITTVNGDLPEGLRDHDNLLAVLPGDIDGLVEAIKELILFPDLRKRLGRNAELLARTRFSWAKIAGEHFALYQRVLEDKRLKYEI